MISSMWLARSEIVLRLKYDVWGSKTSHVILQVYIHKIYYILQVCLYFTEGNQRAVPRSKLARISVVYLS